MRVTFIHKQKFSIASLPPACTASPVPVECDPGDPNCQEWQSNAWKQLAEILETGETTLKEYYMIKTS